ncbi:MAG: O-methyltransferase [bacterium]|nr:O-methyltransferase [bacterium]
MIIDERLLTYLNSLDAGNSPILDTIEKEALATDVPIVRKDMQGFLKMLLAIKQPKRILEVGCAVGFSAILMAEHAPVDCKITTIENWPPRIPIARDNFARANRTEQITLLEGDAGELLPELLKQGAHYDWIFMDAAKGQYPILLPTVVDLLEPGGVLISDNVLFDGEIIESRFVVTRRNRTIHKRMREYLYTLTHHEKLTTSVLTVGDGTAVSVKSMKG